MPSARLFLPFVLVGSAGLAADPPSPTPVRVMSFNIRYGTAKDGANHWDKRKAFVAETAAAFDPDLLGTQETLPDQRDFLAEKLKGYEVFAAGRDDGKNKGEMAAIFYRTARFTKTDGGHFWLSATPDTVGEKGWDAALPRVVTWVKLTDKTAPDGLPVFYLNTHFDHIGKKARLESARLIRAKAAELGQGCRVILSGDFNAGEGSDPYTAMFGETDKTPSPVVDTFRVIHPKRGTEEGSFSGFKATATTGERIDWIAASRDWDVRLAGIDRTSRDGRTPSDHFPVFAVLRAAVPGAPPTLRVLSYNVHHCEGIDGKLDLPRLARVIRATDPDVVALQEMDDKTKRTGGVDQTAELARLTGMNGVFGKAIDLQGGGYGQAVLSRVPLGKAVVHPLPGEPKSEPRIALSVPLTFNGRELLFVTTHLHHLGDELRQKQAAELNKLLADGDRPTILAGDLNATPDSKPLAILAPKWTNATAGAGLFTVPVEKPTMQIDYVLFRPSDAFRVTQATVLGEAVASDHRAVLAVLEWKTK